MEKCALYFGCREANTAGHYLVDHRRRNIVYEIPTDCPWTIGQMDTGLLRNGKHRDVEDGRVWWTCGGAESLWYAFFWWDNSGDSRGQSNSGFYVRGFEPEMRTPETARENAVLAFQYACSVYPKVVARQRHPLVLQEK